MQLFYSTHLGHINQEFQIEDQEHIHLSKVLRKELGDLIFVTNGNGVLFQAEIMMIGKKRTSLITKKIVKEEPRNSTLTIAIAPTKNIARIEWFIEKAVEIGIDKIILFTSNNSERRNINLERLQLKALSAMKQSLKLHLPEVSSLMKFKDLWNSMETNYDQKLIAFVDEKTKNISKYIHSNKKTIVLIGPEGGFLNEEVNLAKQNGFVPVSLGDSRLRTETAGVFVSSAFYMQ